MGLTVIVGGLFMKIVKKERNPIIEITNEMVVNMIHEIRGQKVMLDFELAELYGYSTKRFNEQIKRNIERFPEEFMFRLTSKEVKECRLSQFATASTNAFRNKSNKPYAFTEQGVYMLMTVLKGDTAIKQSIALIKAFKTMKDYISNNNLLPLNEVLKLREQTRQNANAIEKLEERMDNTDKQLQIVMENFVDPSRYKQFVIQKNQRIEADVAFQNIFSSAKENIIIVDNYISVDTLSNLKTTNKNVQITIVSDNKSKNCLTNKQLDDFENDTEMDINVLENNMVTHDRFIVIDFKTDNYIIYLCGSSIKDSGNSLTTITEINPTELWTKIIENLLKNKPKIL